MYYKRCLFGALGHDEFAVETCDVAQRNILGAFSGTSTGVGAVTETKFIHLANHGTCTTLTLYLALGQECELADLSRNEEHSRAVLAGSHTCTTANACSGVHGSVGHFLADGKIVCILGTAAVERHIAAGLLDFVDCITVYHKVADHGECSRTPGFDCDCIAILELTHVELAGGYALHRTVGVTVDVERAHAADTFTAVVIEYHGLFTFFYELLVEHVEHFKEAAAGGNIVEVVVDELSFLFGTTLTPNFQIYADCMFHFDM